MNLDDYEFQKPGRIVEYFPLTQTATVKISNDRSYSTTEDTDLQVAQTLLYDVPVFTAGGGGWHMTFPIKVGDTCLLSFSEFGYDHWFALNEDSGGIRADGNPQPWTNRRFSLDDGFAQVGWNNLPTAIESYSETDSEWRNADAAQSIALQETGDIHIKTGTTTINIAPDGNVTVVAPTVEITGDLTVSGTIVAVGEITSGSVTLTGHVHPGSTLVTTATVGLGPAGAISSNTEAGVG